VQDAVADYIRHLEINNSARSARDTELRLKKHLPANILETELTRLTTVQLQRWHQSLVRLNGDPEDTRKSKDGANKLLAKLRAALNLAFRSGLAASDREWRKVRPFKGVGAARTLFLTDDQVKALLDHSAGAFHALVRAALLTGARYGELRAARAEDFNPEHGTVTLNGKTGERQCYLSDVGLAFFAEQVKGKAPRDLIFERDGGGPWRHGDQYRAMHAVVEQAKLPVDTVFYSFRHYHISMAMAAGIAVQIIAENTGTSVRMIELHYGKFMPADRREMLNRIAPL
jgi:integrase